MSVTSTAGPLPVAPELADRAPGERYYRHPGDVVRLALWASATVLLLMLVELAPDTSDGLRADVGRTATDAPQALRQFLVGCVQVGALVVPVTVVAVLAVQRRWRRLGTLLLAAAAGALVSVPLLAAGPGRSPLAGALTDETWPLAPSFPSPAYVAAAVAACAVGKPWLSRRWRHAADLAVLVVVVAVALAGIAGAPELALAATGGGLAGAAILVAVGAPNRLPSPASVAVAVTAAGLPVEHLDLLRASGGRSQLYRAWGGGSTSFLKVYSQDSRDADVLYRAYRRLLLRRSDDEVLSTLTTSVEHEALVLLLAERAGVACPSLRGVAAVADGSMVLAMSDVGGERLDELPDETVDDTLMRAVWEQVAALHAAGLAHGALRAANVLIDPGRAPVIIDVGAGATAADNRARALDRAELLASLAARVGPEAAVSAAADVLPADDLAAAMPYLQPLALSAASRRAVSKSTLRNLRDGIVESTGFEPVALERLVRVRPRTLIMIATLTGAFYVLLPQLANVDESISALGSANWGWLTGVLVASALTYVAAAIGMMGGVREDLPFVPTVQVSLASSFVNRVTPANVGGMALNVRYMQKAGISPADAVTGVGLNVLAGGIVHIGLLAVFLAWSGRSGGQAFSIPSSSTLLVVIAVVLALVGAALATRRGRGVARAHVLPPLRQSMSSIRTLATSPIRLAALFGGSMGVTLAYVVALWCAVAAFDGGVSFAQVGAVYLGASLIAAAAPTPGGLGALEAALVAGLTGVGMEPAIAVAAVLSYRLLTFWLPVLPGWLCFQLLERRNYV